jgi:PAS domain S-box-containing protein
MVSLADGEDWSRMVTSVSLSGKYAPWRGHGPAPLGAYIEAMMRESRRALRLSQAQLEADPAWREISGEDGDTHAPSSGLLALPLVSRDGQNIGLLVLLNKEHGEFTERDQYVGLELAQLGSIAIENARLFTQIRELNAGLEARIAERTAELTRQELLFRTLAEQAPEVVWNTDKRGRATFLNRAWYELVGGTPEDSLGHGWMSRLHPDDVAEVRGNFDRSRETLQPYGGIRRLLAKDGSYHTMSYKAAPVLDEQGQVAFWVGIDTNITELKAIERALRSSNQELEAFSYSVSHDLRAPLGAIGGFSRALSLKLEGHADERVRHYLARIEAAVEKMEQLIEDLLSLARVARAPVNYGPVDLGALARETLEALQTSQPQRNVTVRVQDALVTQGDARLLRVLMENLLGNAWKFTSTREEALIEVTRLDDSSVFAVRDNGVGFDMAYANKLFGAFQRLHTEAEFPGTGIGLATVRRIVTRHQGRVWAESRVGEGTTFFFTLSEAAPPPWLAGDRSPG